METGNTDRKSDAGKKILLTAVDGHGLILVTLDSMNCTLRENVVKVRGSCGLSK